MTDVTTFQKPEENANGYFAAQLASVAAPIVSFALNNPWLVAGFLYKSIVPAVSGIRIVSDKEAFSGIPDATRIYPKNVEDHKSVLETIEKIISKSTEILKTKISEKYSDRIIGKLELEKDRPGFDKVKQSFEEKLVDYFSSLKATRMENALFGRDSDELNHFKTANKIINKCIKTGEECLDYYIIPKNLEKAYSKLEVDLEGIINSRVDFYADKFMKHFTSDSPTKDSIFKITSEFLGAYHDLAKPEAKLDDATVQQPQRDREL